MTAGVGRWVRRAGVLAAALLLVPTVAVAGFRSSAAAAFAASTMTLATPADVSFSTSCPAGQSTGTVRVKSFSEVPLADGYLVQVRQGGTVLASAKVPRSQAVDLTFTRSGAVDLSVFSTLKSWASTPLTRSLTC